MASTLPWPQRDPSPQERAAFADAEPRAFWLDRPEAVATSPALHGTVDADLCIVGGGFTGLWAALHAKADDPGRDVVVLEAEAAGFGASGRNGGFAIASLTHGLSNGLTRFPDEMPALERLSLENFEGMKADLRRHSIECDFEETGDLSVALEPHQEDWLEEEAELLRRFGHDAVVLDREQVRREVASPTYRGAVWDRTGAALVDPGRLAFGLRDAVLRAGVRLYEHTPASRLEETAHGVALLTPSGRVHARTVLLGTSAFPPLLKRLRHFVVPVYDYALMTEPLDAEQTAALGWENRQGIGDMSNQFHYYRRTADNRILFGGYDAVYRFGGPVGPRHDTDETVFGRLSQHFFTTFPQLEGLRFSHPWGGPIDTDEAVFGRLSQHFFTTFPQLEGLRFSHRWGGAIDTCSRFSVFFGTAHRGRVAYAVGYTGLGVVATRFGARVALDLLDGRDTEATRLQYVRSKPVPFPPEPLRSAVIQLTRNRLAAADRAQGERGLWLRTLDRFGLGFDS